MPIMYNEYHRRRTPDVIRPEAAPVNQARVPDACTTILASLSGSPQDSDTTMEDHESITASSVSPEELPSGMVWPPGFRLLSDYSDGSSNSDFERPYRDDSISVLSDSSDAFDFFKTTEKDMLIAFQQEAKKVCNLLSDILMRMREDEDYLGGIEVPGRKPRYHQYHEMVRDLRYWRSQIKNLAFAILDRTLDLYGHGDDESAYLETKAVSLYVWWRVCKLAADVECWSISPNPAMTDGCLQRRMWILKLFEELLVVFYQAIRQDVDFLKTGSIAASPNILVETGFVSIEDLMDEDLFQMIPRLDVLPPIESDYRRLGRADSITALNEDGFGDDEVAKQYSDQLELIFMDHPTVSADYDRILKRMNPVLTSTTILAKNQHRFKPYSIKTLHTNRLFRDYIDQIQIHHSSSSHNIHIVKEIYIIYQNLLRGTHSIKNLYKRLRYLLSDTPDLLQEFKQFVPVKHLAKWQAAEHYPLIQEGIAEFKCNIRTIWPTLTEKLKIDDLVARITKQVKTSDPLSETSQLPVYPYSIEQKTEFSMRAIRAAVDHAWAITEFYLPHSSGKKLVMARMEQIARRLRMLGDEAVEGYWGDGDGILLMERFLGVVRELRVCGEVEEEGQGLVKEERGIAEEVEEEEERFEDVVRSP